MKEQRGRPTKEQPTATAKEQPPITGDDEMHTTAKSAEGERPAEQREGLSAERRGSPAAPSDRPEGDTPHPQDVNEIAR